MLGATQPRVMADLATSATARAVERLQRQCALHTLLARKLAHGNTQHAVRHGYQLLHNFGAPKSRARVSAIRCLLSILGHYGRLPNCMQCMMQVECPRALSVTAFAALLKASRPRVMSAKRYTSS